MRELEVFRGWRYGCPYCGSVSIRKRVKTQDYRCTKCGEVFEKPLDRNMIY